MNAIRTWRKQRDLTQEQMADLLGVSASSLSRMERGEQWPDREFFEKLISVTDGAVTANDFLCIDQREEAA